MQRELIPHTGNTNDNLKVLEQNIIDQLAPRIKPISDSTYTLLNEDHGLILDFLVACTVTVPAGLYDDFTVGISQGGTGQVTLVGAGATVANADAQLKTEKRYVLNNLTAFAQNSFRYFGRTAP